MKDTQASHIDFIDATNNSNEEFNALNVNLGKKKNHAKVIVFWK